MRSKRDLMNILLLISCAGFFMAVGVSLASGAAATTPTQEALLVDNPAVMGEWGGLIPWPDKAVHSVILRTGKVLWYRERRGTLPHSRLAEPPGRRSGEAT